MLQHLCSCSYTSSPPHACCSRACLPANSHILLQNRARALVFLRLMRPRCIMCSISTNHHPVVLSAESRPGPQHPHMPMAVRVQHEGEIVPRGHQGVAHRLVLQLLDHGRRCCSTARAQRTHARCAERTGQPHEDDASAGAQMAEAMLEHDRTPRPARYQPTNHNGAEHATRPPTSTQPTEHITMIRMPPHQQQPPT